jgi:hypothetical protein
MLNIAKINSGIKLTSSDFKIYKTLSQCSLENLNDVIYGTIIVTRNGIHQKINAFIANLWAHHFNTNAV